MANLTKGKWRSGAPAEEALADAAQPIDLANAVEETSTAETSEAVKSGGLITLSRTVCPVQIPNPTDVAMVGRLLNSALSVVSSKSKMEEIKVIEQDLKKIPFRMYEESAIVALKKGIAIEQYVDFIQHRIGPRYQLPSKNIGELLDSMYIDLNQVSITEFCFKQEPDGTEHDDVNVNAFTFARMVVYRRQKSPGKEVMDLGYCFFNVKFAFGSSLVITEFIDTEIREIQKKFLFFTIGSDSQVTKTSRQVEEFKKFQMDWKSKDQIQEYFRWKAVTALSQDSLQKGEDCDMSHSHPGISPIEGR